MLSITGKVGELDVGGGQSLLEDIDLLLNLKSCLIEGFPRQLKGVNLVVKVLDAGIQLSIGGYGITGIARSLGIELAIACCKSGVGGLGTDSTDETLLPEFLCVVGVLGQLCVGGFKGGLEGSKLGYELGGGFFDLQGNEDPLLCLHLSNLDKNLVLGLHFHLLTLQLSLIPATDKTGR